MTLSVSPLSQVWLPGIGVWMCRGGYEPTPPFDERGGDDIGGGSADPLDRAIKRLRGLLRPMPGHNDPQRVLDCMKICETLGFASKSWYEGCMQCCQDPSIKSYLEAQLCALSSAPGGISLPTPTGGISELIEAIEVALGRKAMNELIRKMLEQIIEKMKEQITDTTTTELRDGIQEMIEEIQERIDELTPAEEKA